MPPVSTLTNKSRDLILDMLRGYYLLVILVDHLSFKYYPSPYEFLNGYGNLWVSAAEGFIFISGLLVGIIYTPKLKTLGFKMVSFKLLKRSLQLFSYHVILTLLFSFLSSRLGNWPYLSGGLMQEPFIKIIKATLNLQYNYGWADVLVLYAVFMFFAPLFTYFINRGLAIIPLTLSFTLWVYSFNTEQVYNSSLSSFEMLSWQFLFYLGLVIGSYKSKITAAYYKHKKTYNVAVTVVFLTSLCASVGNLYFGILGESTLLSKLFIKETLGPGRLILFLFWFSFFYLMFKKLTPLINKYLSWLLLTYGKKSLVTYITQSFLLYFVFYLPQTSGPVESFLATTAAIIVVWITVRLVVSTNFIYMNIKSVCNNLIKNIVISLRL